MNGWFGAEQEDDCPRANETPNEDVTGIVSAFEVSGGCDTRGRNSGCYPGLEMRPAGRVIGGCEPEATGATKVCAARVRFRGATASPMHGDKHVQYSK